MGKQKRSGRGQGTLARLRAKRAAGRPAQAAAKAAGDVVHVKAHMRGGHPVKAFTRNKVASVTVYQGSPKLERQKRRMFRKSSRRAGKYF